MNSSAPVIEEIRRRSIPLRTAADLGALVEAAGDARYVLLGEASHGTSEFYRYRAELTRRLVEEKGFRMIAVEGDWPSCFTVNRYVKWAPGAPETAEAALQDFNRWPTWMWANREMIGLIDWLRRFNEGREPQDRAGFYGIDVYSLWESMDEILRYLDRKGPKGLLQTAKQAFACFEPYWRQGQSYGISSALYGEGCEEEVVQLLTQLRSARHMEEGDSEEAGLHAEVNALVTLNAERYYRTMITDDAESWNVRDRHMVEALSRIVDFYGPSAKAIIWEHNTHIGDARATDMAAEGMVNVGQLLREREPEGRVYAVGFGTYAGTVIAAAGWGEEPEVMNVPPGQAGSWEALMHEAGGYDKLLFVGEVPAFRQSALGHRAIGVVYHPAYERGNYVPTVIAKRYDAFIHVDRTEALHPLAVEPVYV